MNLSDKFGLKCEKELIVVNKIDLNRPQLNQNAVLVSGKTREGIEDFIEALRKDTESLCTVRGSECAALTCARHRRNVSKAVEYLQQYLIAEEDESDWVVCAHHLRKAIHEIGSITGKVSSEKILDFIFADFRIGK